MEFRDALKALRSELGVTQTELASVLRVNTSTVARWESGKTFPYRPVFSSLLEYAQSRQLSDVCMRNLKQAIKDAGKSKFEQMNGELYTVEHSSISQLVDEAPYPIYVCDYETDTLLYMNRKTEEATGMKLDDETPVKCYECLMHRDSPCPFCHKSELVEEHFRSYEPFIPEAGGFLKVDGKLTRWNGRLAHVHRIINLDHSVDINALHEKEETYRESIERRMSLTNKAIASARYNLTKNTVSNVITSNEKWAEIVAEESIDDILRRIADNALGDEERKQFDSIGSRDALIRAYYNGKTHISLRHRVKGQPGYYEGIFDLMQNPITYDIEAFAVMRDITEETMTRQIVDTLYRTNYETITTIDATTGEAHPYFGSHIQDVIQEQKAAKDNVTGVEAYLRKYCVDDDVDRVIRETSLSYVKDMLERQKTHTVSYTLRQDGRSIHKRALYTYLDNSKLTLLCTMQDVTETVRESIFQRDRLAESVKTLKEICGMDIARYDLKTKKFYSDCAITVDLGYDEVIENVPDTFINDGHVAPESIQIFRSFWEKLRNGEATVMSPHLQAKDGSFHLFKANSHIVYDEQKQPYQAVVAFQDVDELRENSSAYRLIKQRVSQLESDRYAIHRWNLTQGSFFAGVEGYPESVGVDYQLQTIDERTDEYASKNIHPDDAIKYRKLVKADNLRHLYVQGVREAHIEYRDFVNGSDYHWKRLTLEMAQYPDCTDIELVMLFESMK